MMIIMNDLIQEELKAIERILFRNTREIREYLLEISEITLAYTSCPLDAQLSYSKVNNSRILIKLEDHIGYCTFKVTKLDLINMYYVEFDKGELYEKFKENA